METGKKFKPAMAPFNFVSISDKAIVRYKSLQEIPKHNKLYKKEDGFYSGEIAYSIHVDEKDPASVLMIGADTGNSGRENSTAPKTFFKNAEGKYTIPGSSVRGMIRSNVQILGMCSPIRDIDDTTFLYRDWASTDAVRKKHYKEEIDLRPMCGEPGKVRAGYIRQRRKDDFLITPACTNDGKTFYRVSEAFVRHQLGDRPQGVNYMYTADISGKKDYELKAIQNRDYKPYIRSISFNIDNAKERISQMSLDQEKYTCHGYLMCAGFIQKKKAHYVVLEKDRNAAEIRIGKSEVDAYEDDLTKKKMRKEQHQYYQLPAVEAEKPIFYVPENNSCKYFGMTPYLRIFYENSVCDGIPAESDGTSFDYADSMFGFSFQEKKKDCRYRSRVSFSDAVSNDAKEGAERKMVLAEPKPTCYPEYLDQPEKDIGKLVSYADSGFKIRGIKQYWFIDQLRQCPADAKPKVVISVKPVESGNFPGKIYFENLQKDELGLLLYALKLEDGAYQSLGLGKPYGYGKVELTVDAVKVYDFEKMYSDFFSTKADYQDVDIDEFVDFYKRYVQSEYGIPQEEEKNVRELLYMRTHIMKKADSEYQNLSDFRYHRVLPYALDYAGEIADYKKSPQNYTDFGNNFSSHGNGSSGKNHWTDKKSFTPQKEETFGSNPFMNFDLNGGGSSKKTDRDRRKNKNWHK